MNRTHAKLVLTLLVSTLGSSAAFAAPVEIDPNNPRQGRFADDWMEIYMGGGKVGYAHSTMTREGDRILTSTVVYMRIGRVDKGVEISTKQTTVETIAGLPLEFASELNASAVKTSMRGRVANGKVALVSSQFGMEQKQEFDFHAGALMTWGLFREGLIRGLTPGLTYTVKTYSPDLRLDDAVDAVTRIGELETFTDAHGEHRGHRVSVTIESPIGSMELVSWLRPDGKILRAVMPAPGIGDMEMVATDQATALADFLPPEIFMTTTIAANRTIDTKRTDRITYLITSSNAKADLSDMPETGMQSVTVNDDGSIKLVVQRQPHKRLLRAQRATRAHHVSAHSQKHPDLQDYLDSNLIISTDDPQLIALAKRAAGDEREPFALADKLRRFVTDYIITKNLNIGFATASEVCRNREGDCSEHGVLLAALGRLNGIPSRVAVGLAYVPAFGGRKDIFGYHMWTQFYIDDRWIDVDAALRETNCSPIRIAFATSSLKSNGLAELSLPLLAKIGAINIDITNVKTTESNSD